jgi:hypothetical protein
MRDPSGCISLRHGVRAWRLAFALRRGAGTASQSSAPAFDRTNTIRGGAPLIAAVAARSYRAAGGEDLPSSCRVRGD